MSYELIVTLRSDTTFARGDGAGTEVDTEVEYDVTTGLPFVRGRVLKGLLTEECANLLFALGDHSAAARLAATAERWFGRAGSTMLDDGALRIGTARLPADLIAAVRSQVDAKTLQTADVLASLTDVRRQTSVDDNGLPADGSLRSARVVLRGVTFTAPLHISAADADGLALLAACVKAVRRGGLGRNRGRGRLELHLHADGADVTERHFTAFAVLIGAGK
ncbi:MAG: hypothetical protein NTZ50_12000 [Chloroflexi bacterium]|nr:hypothetical protein [Chloroflexota bacterium]